MHLKHLEPGTVACAWSPSYLGGWRGRISCAQDLETSLDNIASPPSLKQIKLKTKALSIVVLCLAP